MGRQRNALVTELEVGVEHRISGDALLVYTDGIPEALDESRRLYTNERFLSVLRPVIPSSSRDLVGEVEKALADFVGEADRSDDVTLMALHRRP